MHRTLAFASIHRPPISTAMIFPIAISACYRPTHTVLIGMAMVLVAKNKKGLASQDGVLWPQNAHVKSQATPQSLSTRLMTVQEVAKWVRVHPKTVYRWIEEKELPAICLRKRTYRIPEDDLEEFLQQRYCDRETETPE